MVTLVMMMAPSVSALTADELAAQIAALQAQLAALNSQLNQTTPAASGSFDTNLYFGLKNAKVTALQEFLISKGHLAAGLNTSYFGSLTKAAVMAYQTAKGITPVAGYFGPLTRAAANADSGVVTPSPSPGASPSPSTAPSADAVSLGSVSAASAVAKNAQNVTFFNLNFAAGSTAYTVSKIVVSRGGVSADADIAAVKLYDGMTQVGSSQALNTTTHKATFSINWQVPANTTKVLTVKANIAPTGTSTTGNSITLGVAAASDITSTSAGLAGSFPMVSNAMNVSGTAVGVLDVDVQTGLVPASTILSGAVEQEIAAWKFAASSVEGFSVKSIKVTHTGSATRTDVKNLKLKVVGAQIGSTVTELASDNTGTFDLSASPLVLNAGQSKYVYAYADTAAGINTSRSVIFEITQATDVDAYGSNSGGGVTITKASGGSGTAFTSQTGATMTIGQGTLVTALDSAQNPATQSYVVGTTNRLMTALKFSTGSREGARLTELKLTLAGTNAAATDIANITLWDGTAQVGGSGSVIGSTVTFGTNTIGWDSSGLFDIAASTNKTILVKADIPNGANTTHTVSLSVGNAAHVKADGLASQYDLPAASVTGTATGNAHTIAAYGTLAVSLASTTPSAQTYVKGATGKEFTKINFTAGTGEDILVSAVTIKSYAATGTGTATASGDVTNVKLMKADGTQFGSTVSAPSTTESFSGSLTVTSGNTATLTVVADIPTTTALGSAGVHFDVLASTVATDVTSTGVYSTADVTETGGATGNLMVVGTGSLTVSVASSPADQTAILNASGVTYAGFVLTAGSAEDVRVSSIKLTRTSSGTGADADLSNLALYSDAGARLTAYKSLATATVTFSASDFLNSLGIDVTKGQQKLIYAKADVPSTATNNDKSSLGIDIAGSVIVTGLTSNTNPNATLTAGPGTSTGVNWKTGTPAATDLYEVTLSSGGSLTLALNPDTPITASQAVGVQDVNGKAGVSFTKLLFTAANEAVNLKSFLVIRSAGASAADGDFTAIKLYDGTTLVASGYLSGGTVEFNLTADKYISVPKNGTKVLTLVGDLAGVGTSGGASTGDDPKLGVQYNVQSGNWSASYANKYNVSAEGADSKSAIYAAASAALYGNTQIVRQSVPTLATGTLPSTLLSSGTKTLYKWTVSSDSVAATGWDGLVFKFTGSIHVDSTTVRTIGTDDTTTIKVDGVYMIVSGDGNADTKLIDEGTMKVYNSATNTQVAGAWYFRTDTDANAGTYAVFVPTAEEVVAAGTTNTYELRGDLGYGGFTGDAVLVNVPDLASAVATGSLAAVFGTANAADSNTNSTTITKSFAWSDRSNASHTTSTADWSDDYKVPGVPMSTLTLSK